MLLRKLLKGHSKCAKETFHLDAELLAFRFVIMKRRHMYLHHILSRPETELIRKVYEVQKQINTKNDWYGMVQQNRKDLKIILSDEEISRLSEEKFKSIVKRAVETETLDYLNNIAGGHSKSEDLVKPKLTREKYFEDTKFSKSEVELLFSFRTRMVCDIKANFPSQHKNNLVCDLCQVAIDCQEHLLSCSKLRQYHDIPKDVQYADLFKETEKQLKIVKLFKHLLRARELLKSN